MKHKKYLFRLLSAILTIPITGTALSCIPAMSVSASPHEGIDYVYVEVQRQYVKLDPINDEEAEIVGWYEMPSYGIIPETMDGYKIVGIGNSAFWCCDSIYGLKLPDTIRYIDKGAFFHCGKLDEINIPDAVHYIGDTAFEECVSLESIDLPDGITYIGEGAFWLCDSLKSFTFPKGVTEVADNVLSNNKSLKTINMHDGITKICGNSLRNNPSLESLYIPDSVTEIGEDALINCSSLKSIHLPEGWTEINDYMFSGSSSLESFTIPDTITKIGNGAFYQCPNLKSLTIPDSVTFMGERSVGYIEGVPDWTYALVDGFTLYGSSGSTAEQYANENNITFIASSPFDYKTNEEGTLTITGYHGTSKELVIPSEINGTAVTQIANFAFTGTDIESIVIPDNITKIGACICENCTNLRSVTLPSNISIFNEMNSGGQFRGCTSLESIVLPDTLESIGPFTFEGCTKLEYINTPASLRSLDAHVFENTAWQNSQPDGPIYFGNILCDCKGSIPENTEITVRKGTKSIAAGAFSAETSKNIVLIELPDGLEIIDELALFNCTRLKNIFIPGSVTYIADKAIGYYFDEKENKFSKYDGLTIYGKAGSTAERYANENGIPFADPDALKNTSVINSDIVQIGDKVRISASAAGGTSPYTYAYYYKRSTNSTWRVLGTEFGKNSSVAFAPTSEADYDIKVIVKDSTGATAENFFTVKAVKELELTNVSVVGREKVYLGSAIPMIGKAVGGKSPYTYSFYFKRSTNTNWKLLGEKFQTTATARFKPLAKGSYDIRIDVKDSSGTIAKKVFSSTVK